MSDQRARRDRTPRTAIICAYAPELPMLEARVTGARRRLINGIPFITGRLSRRPVVLLLSGMSLVNAAMATQLAIDRFTVERIVVCGIAGGADPALEIGAVIAPARWAQALEATFARDLGGGVWGPDILADPHGLPNFGMIFPHAPEVFDTAGRRHRKLWFEADPTLLAIARTLTGPDGGLHVGGAGVSSPTFIDNAAVCAWLYDTFQAQAVDMESAAIAQVAHANTVPFIAIRGVSDRAGAEAGPNTALINVHAIAERAAAAVEKLVAALD